MPLVDHRERVKRHGTWIGQDTSGFRHVEAWRLFLSGHFVQRRVVASDLEDAPELKATTPDAVGVIAVWDVLLYLVEVAELAARLASVMECDRVAIEVAIHGTARRQLVFGDWNREFLGPYIVDAATLKSAAEVPAIDLVADPVTVGIRLTQGILRQFGAALPDQLLRDLQSEILRR